MNDKQPSRYSLHITDWHTASTALRSVREQVFIQEQAVPVELEWDEYDTEAIHILVQDDTGQAIATARLLKDGHIGRMAVVKAWRGQGIGRQMLKTLLNYCKEHQLQPFLEAQTHAIPFYQALGFQVCSEIYEDAGIPHRKMQYRGE